jgi:orotidine-5'-phosphate decarboxylase
MNPLIVALDVPTVDEAVSLTEQIGDAAGAYKVGLELFGAQGPNAVRALGESKIFLDLKLHDIPTTVARAIRALAPLKAELLTVHALGGRAMLEAANDAKREEKVLAVTVLTHLDDAACKEAGLPPPAEAVPALAELAFAAGCDGVICAPADIESVRAVCPAPFLVVTPGVRPKDAEHDEQARVRTPGEAIKAGADRIVVGRPVTRARDPRAAAQAILAEIG